MLKRTFWTHRRFTGLTLMLGCSLFLGGAGLLPRDTQGDYVVNLSQRDALLVIASQTTQAQWSTSVFMSGVIVTALGFALLTGVLWDKGERAFSHLALVSTLFGAVLLLIALALSLGVDPLAAQETTSTGGVPSYYEPLSAWSDALFQLYTVLADAALTLYGAALLVSRLLPRWLGWTAVLYGLAGLVVLAVVGGVPPFLHFLLPIVMGILLLPRRYQRPTASHQQEATTASPLAVE